MQILQGGKFSPTISVMQKMLQELLDAKCSLSDISKHMCMSPATLTRILKGKTQKPNARVLDRLLRYYCIYLSTLSTQVA